jgi:hypothetical protein
MTMEGPMLCKLMETSYHAARDLLLEAAREMDEAGSAARQGNPTLARGIAVGAEADLLKAVDLVKAVGVLQRLG